MPLIRLNHAIDSIGAKRVVIDTLETLFSGLGNVSAVRAELRRLFRWLKDKKVTAIITAEKGEGTLTRHGLEEYVSDCVIVLDHRIEGQISTRRLRILKYRGTSHATNEFPFLIDEDGISVLPITSLKLQHTVSTERIGSGIKPLDEMLGGQGFYRGSTILISGTAGTGKTTFACHAVEASCQRNEKVMYFLFEESEEQLKRNMLCVGLDLGKWTDEGLLQFQAVRPTLNGLEMHLTSMHKKVEQFKPDLVVVDPISNFVAAGNAAEATSMLVRLIDHLKSLKTTAILINLTHREAQVEQTDLKISSLIDTWITLRDIELNGERNKIALILKSRGMQHSNQLREFTLTNSGVQMTDVYLGADGVLTGTTRLNQEARESAASIERANELKRKERELARKRKALEANILALELAFESEKEELEQSIANDEACMLRVADGRNKMALSRQAVKPTNASNEGPHT